MSLVASAIAAATGVLYIALLIRQGTPVPLLTTGLVTGAIAALVVLTAYGSLGPLPVRRAIALWAALPGFLGLGYLAAFSIGGLLLIGGVMVFPAAVAASRGIHLARRAVAWWAVVILLGWVVVLDVLLMAASSQATP